MEKINNYSRRLLNFFKTSEYNSWANVLPFSGLHPEEKYCVNKYLGTRRCSAMDMGTGGGRIALALSQRGFAPVLGFDFTPEFIDTARLNAERHHLDIKFEIGSALDIPLPNNRIEVAIYFEKLFSYLPKIYERQQTAKEAFRVLSPGGYLFSSYNHFPSRRLNNFLSLYSKLMRTVFRKDLPDRSLPILTRGGKITIHACLPSSPQVYWHYADEAIFELTNMGFHVLETFSSFGFRQNTMDCYDGLKKGILYIVAQKPYPGT